MKRTLALIGVIAGVASGACDQTALDAPALREAPLEASGQQFQVQGDIRVSTCTVTGGVTTRTPRAAFGLLFHARGNATPTCKDDQGQPLTGQALIECTDLVGALRSSAVLNHGSGAPGDESYSMAPQQWILHDQDNDPLTPAMQLPVHYWLAWLDGALQGPRFSYQGGSRRLWSLRPVPVFNAPALAGGTVSVPILSEDMASYRLRLRYTPTIRDASGKLLASDKIIGVSMSVALQNTPTSPTRYVSHDFEHVCPNGGTCVNDASLDPNVAAGASRFLNVPAVDDDPLIAGDQHTPQEILLELPITPNSTGFYSGDAYTASASILFADGIRVAVTMPFAQATVAPCATVDQTVDVQRPPTEISGSIRLKPLDLAGPVVQSYAPTVRQTGAGFYAVDLSNDPTYVAPASATSALGFTLRGVPAGAYRIESPRDSTTNSMLLHGHARLTYPGRAPLAWDAAYRAVFRFPMRGPYETDGEFTVTEADANADGRADAPVTLNIDADMAYLAGSLTLAGCPPEVTAAAADITGAAARGDDEYTRGFSRGLSAPFVANSANNSVSGGYLVAAIAGDWVERRYLVDIGGTNQTGFLIIEPATLQTYTLAVNGSTPTVAPARAYAMSKATITLAAKDGSGTIIPSRNPRLEIHAAASLGSFSDPVSNTPLGKYYAAAQRIDDLQGSTHTLEIVAPASPTEVLIQPTVEVQSGAGWSRTSFPAIAITLAGSVGEGCSDVCVDSAVTPPATYTDDGQPPSVTAPASLTLVEGATATTVIASVSDHLAILSVTANGIPMNRVGTTDQYTATVPVTAATSAITIVAQDQCRKTTTKTTAVIWSPDVCLLPAYDVCTESAPGSVFLVDLIDDLGHACQLPCTIAGAGQAVSCNPAAITCAN